ncbi:MAG: ATP-binding protein [Candidatus Nanohalarchaeota archaeon]|nr:MAG: ATP-binding protein [Candidatus Nanohaloarchaeota archaeon]
MELKDIIEVLSPLNFWGREQEIGIKREEYLNKIAELSEAKDMAVSITGIRRCGKTTLAKQYLKENIEKGFKKEQTLYINFEEPKFEPYLNTDFLDEIYRAYRTFINRDESCIIVLDEVQNLTGWEKWVRIMLEKKEKAKIIITGSNSKLIDSELSTVLTGRALVKRAYPLDFAEFLLFKGNEMQKSQYMAKAGIIRNNMIEYILSGGFPQIINEKENLKAEILKEIFYGIINKDIINRYGFKNPHLVKVTAELIINNYSSLLSANRLRNSLVNIFKENLSPNHIIEIMKSFEDTYLLHYVPLFSKKVKQIKQYPKKIYCVDTGIINVVALKYCQNFGKLAENIVAVYLIRKYRKENIFYWRNIQQEEVDFIIKENFDVSQIIQVCWNMDEEKTRKREIRSLLKAAEEFNLDKGLIITENTQTEEIVENKKIICIPLWKWLLEN